MPPAEVLVLGAGVAGLAAIQTAKNMGAVRYFLVASIARPVLQTTHLFFRSDQIVRAFDVRSVCKEQVESMGATFLEVEIEEDAAGKRSNLRAFILVTVF